MNTRYLERKDEIKAALIAAAEDGPPFPSYEDFGRPLRLGNMRGSKDVLDWIAIEEEEDGRPDITYVLHNRATKYPSYIDGRPANPPSAEQKRKARDVMAEIIKRYCPGAANPYG